MDLGLLTAPSATTDASDTGQQFSPRHLTSVDALRGIAAVYVVCFHLVLLPQPNLGVPSWANPLLMAGGTGVGLFFVVSAFTLSLSWFSRRDGAHPVRNFYLRRVFRIVPLYYVLLVATLLRDWLVWRNTHSLSEIALSITMLFNLAPGRGTGIVWASWTIGVEMLFYLMFPLMMLFAGTTLRKAICLPATLAAEFLFYEIVHHSLATPSTKGTYFTTGLPIHFPVFVLGLIAYTVFSSESFRRIRSKWVGAVLIAAALMIHVGLSYSGVYRGPLRLEWSTLAWLPLVLGLTIYPLWLIVNAVTRFYGRISYSVYLNHPIVVMFLRPFYAGVYRRIHEFGVALTICVIVTFSLLTPLAYLTYRFIEQPGIRLGSLMIKWLKSRPASSG